MYLYQLQRLLTKAGIDFEWFREHSKKTPEELCEESRTLDFELSLETMPDSKTRLVIRTKTVKLLLLAPDSCVLETGRRNAYGTGPLIPGLMPYSLSETWRRKEDARQTAQRGCLEELNFRIKQRYIHLMDAPAFLPIRASTVYAGLWRRNLVQEAYAFLNYRFWRAGEQREVLDGSVVVCQRAFTRTEIVSCLPQVARSCPNLHLLLYIFGKDSG